MLEKMGTKKRYEYYPGDELTFKTANEDYFTRAVIAGLGDSVVIFQDRIVPIKTITAVDISDYGRKSFARYAGPYLMAAGVILITFDIINQTAVQGGSYEPSTGLYVTSGILVATGAILTFVKKDKKKLDKWWRLRYVNI